MPELPEVETARKFVHKLCAGSSIVRVSTREQGQGPRDGLFDEIVFEGGLDPSIAEALKRIPTSQSSLTTDVKKKSSKKAGNTPATTVGSGDSAALEERESSYQQALLQRTLAGVRRKGKQIWFEFEESKSKGKTSLTSISELAVLFHFGMTGSFVIRDHAIPTYKSFKIVTREEWPPKFTKLELEFSNGIHIAFCDPRRLGRVKLRLNPRDCPPLSNLALDPSLDTLPTPSALRDIFQAYSTSVKGLILDQEKVFCGIGNYLADEVLYQAGIHPDTRACDINEEGCKRLLQKLQYIINTAIEADANYDYFPKDWLFHYRWDKVKANSGEKIRMPDGSPIVFETCGGRTSAVVLSAQPKNGYYLAKQVTAKSSVSKTTANKKQKLEIKMEQIIETEQSKVVDNDQTTIVTTTRKRKVKEEQVVVQPMVEVKLEASSIRSSSKRTKLPSSSEIVTPTMPAQVKRSTRGTKK